MKHVKESVDILIKNIEQVIIGKGEAVELAIIGLLCQGHLLIEDIPGVGKTMLARSLSRSLGCSFSRIQFTPDMLPSDVIGVTIFNQVKREFEFRPGPIMAQFVLADEINRATPKTQSALLEAMEEHQVTVDGVTHKLPDPFLVIATQNPIEYEGTFPLPEAQVDRFFIRLHLGYPSLDNEINILEQQQYSHPIHELRQVLAVEELLELQNAVRKIYVSKKIKRYIVELVRQTRLQSEVYLGASPRGGLALFHAVQALAAITGREFVIPDDVQKLAIPTLAHRIILSPEARLKDSRPSQVIREIIESISVPGGDPRIDMLSET